jgi:hypothetical protein
MIELTTATYLAVTVGAFLIGVMKAGTGGGLGPLVTAVLVLSLPADAALGLQLPLLMVGDAFALGALWRRWNVRLGVILLAGSSVGIVAGMLVLTSISPDDIRRFVGIVALLFVVASLIEPRLRRLADYRPGIPVGLAAGAVAGVASTLAHAGGPPAAIYLLLHRVKPVEFTSTMLLVFAVVNVVKVPAYSAAGLFRAELFPTLVPAIPMLVLGVYLGRRFVTRIDKRRFDLVIVVLLAITGVSLLVG